MTDDRNGTELLADRPILFDAHLGVSRPLRIDDETQFIKGQALVLIFISILAVIGLAMI